MKKTTKREQKLAARRRESRKGTPNPFPALPKDFIESQCATLSVTAALMGASNGEKILVAALIPYLLTLLRGMTSGKKDIDDVLIEIGERARSETDKTAKPKEAPRGNK